MSTTLDKIVRSIKEEFPEKDKEKDIKDKESETENDGNTTELKFLINF